MLLIHSKNELKSELNQLRENNQTIGYVPTMGALHEGHLSLIEKSVSNCNSTVISIFVNPTQFDNPEDLDKYPRNVANDLKKLKERFSDNLLIFAPSSTEIYGEELQAEQFDFGEIENKMEGASRDDHFNGVGTVLKKFFTLINPDQAFFGEKDYQQLLIVKKLVEILNLPLQIVGCPVSRTKKGLARSSRNKRLTPQQKKEALLLYKSLKWTKINFGVKTAAALVNKIKQDFKSHPDFTLDYFEIADAETLESVTNFKDNKKYRAFIAAFIGEVRLIDNMALN